MPTPIQDRTYRANYLVYPVSCLSSMPQAWQKIFAQLMDEFSEAFPEAAIATYEVTKTEDGEPVKDTYGNRHTRFDLSPGANFVDWERVSEVCGIEPDES